MQRARSDPTAPFWVAAFAFAVVLVVAAVLLFGRTAAITGLPVCLVLVVRLVRVIAGRWDDDDD